MDVSVSVTRRDFFQAKSWIRRLLDLIDCKTNAQGTPFANKELAEYRVNCAKSTIVRGSPAYSKQSARHVEGASRLAAGLLRTCKLKLGRKIGRELRPSDPIVPFLVNSVGWMITRFQPRSHGGSSYRLIFGRECSGEIAEMGEQLWYRLAARVPAGRGK